MSFRNFVKLKSLKSMSIQDIHVNSNIICSCGRIFSNS